jgi:hypothetical protein
MDPGCSSLISSELLFFSSRLLSLHPPLRTSSSLSARFRFPLMLLVGSFIKLSFCHNLATLEPSLLLRKNRSFLLRSIYPSETHLEVFVDIVAQIRCDLGHILLLPAYSPTPEEVLAKENTEARRQMCGISAAAPTQDKDIWEINSRHGADSFSPRAAFTIELLKLRACIIERLGSRRCAIHV